MKKIGFLSLLIMASLLLTLVFPVAAAGPKTPSAPTAPVAAAAPLALIAAAMPERHPHIDEALEAMRSAKHHLESAEHDFRGHRAKAIEDLDRAIARNRKRQRLLNVAFSCEASFEASVSG